MPDISPARASPTRESFAQSLAASASMSSRPPRRMALLDLFGPSGSTRIGTWSATGSSGFLLFSSSFFWAGKFCQSRSEILGVEMSISMHASLLRSGGRSPGRPACERGVVISWKPWAMKMGWSN
eukprot:4678579-Pyramimonas_sp.AAC.1